MVDVRRLAAVDMHGAAGTLLRRRIILAEFAFGALAGVGLGIWVLTAAAPLGIWAIGIGLNYLPLAIYAIRLSPAGALERELAGIDVDAELRRYTVAQLWIFVPLLFAVLAALQEGARRRWR